MDANTMIAIASVLLLIGILISMGIGRLMDRHAVKHSQQGYAAPAVMSHAESAPIAPLSPSPREGDAPLPVPSPERSLTEDRVFRDMVLLRTKQGKWFFSGKKLYTTWGGNHDELLARIRELRGEIDPETAPADLTLTPYAGRPTRSSYYPNEPELEYSPPD